MLQLIVFALAFTLILVLVSRRVSLGLALLIASIMVGLSMGRGVVEPLLVMLRALIESDTIELAVTVCFITLLSRQMRDFGLLDRMVRSFSAITRSARVSMVIIPGILGCLAVPGGAIISAPIVDSLGDQIALDSRRKAAVNVIFRHAWFFIFPFNPSMVLCARLTGVDAFEIIRVLWPLTLAAIIAGLLVTVRPGWRFRRRAAAGGARGTPAAGAAAPDVAAGAAAPDVAAALEPQPGLALLVGRFAVGSAPLALALTLYLGWGVLLPLSLLLGLLLGFVIAAGERELTLTRALSTLRHGIEPSLVLAMIGIMVFKSVVTKLDAIPALVQALLGGGLPPLVLLFGLPGIIGLTSGAQSSAVGVAVPVLLGTATSLDQQIVYASVIYSAALLSYFLSPLHLCQTLTAEHFHVRLSSLYRYYVPFTVMITAGTALIYFLYR